MEGGAAPDGHRRPPTVLCAYAMGEKVPLHFLGEVHFFTKVISSLSLLLPRPIAKEEAALRNVFSALKWSWKPQLGFKQNMHGAGTVLQLIREG